MSNSAAVGSQLAWAQMGDANMRAVLADAAANPGQHVTWQFVDGELRKFVIAPPPPIPSPIFGSTGA